MAEAAMVLGISERQSFRLKARIGKEGVRGVIHGNRGRSSSRKLSLPTHHRIVDLARGKYRGFNDHHLTEKLAEVEGVQVSRETVHGLIEDEFYEVERFRSRQEFLAKAATYTLWFNVARTNSYTGHKTPWELIRGRDPTIRPEIVALPPVLLDELFIQRLDGVVKGGYDVIPHP